MGEQSKRPETIAEIHEEIEEQLTSAPKAMISLVIPVYKEAENLPRVIRTVERALNDTEHELIIVDDNSPDGTGKLAEELAEKNGNIKVIHRNRKLGVASAIAEGMRTATGEVIGTINADMLQAPELFPVMLNEIDKHDIVIGSRYATGGYYEKGFWRGLVSKGARNIARLLLPTVRGVNDPISGFFFFKREVIKDAQISAGSLSGNVSIGVKFLLELLVKGSYNSVIEIPYSDQKRKSGGSKFRLRDYFAYLRHVLYLMRISGELNRVVKFCIVGGIGIGIYEGLLFLLTDKLGLLYLISAVFGWIGAVSSNFMFNDLWTFKDLRKQGASNILKRAMLFIGVRLVSLAMNLGILFCLTEFLGLHYLISALIAITMVMIWNYFASLNLVWKKRL